MSDVRRVFVNTVTMPTDTVNIIYIDHMTSTEHDSVDTMYFDQLTNLYRT